MEILLTASQNANLYHDIHIDTPYEVQASSQPFLCSKQCVVPSVLFTAAINYTFLQSYLFFSQGSQVMQPFFHTLCMHTKHFPLNNFFVRVPSIAFASTLMRNTKSVVGAHGPKLVDLRLGALASTMG